MRFYQHKVKCEAYKHKIRSMRLLLESTAVSDSMIATESLGNGDLGIFIALLICC